ncbi:MAG: DUF721 domain-containing protein [Candidatus Binatia bacterium]|nr:DUF721 domain-containing protein [Candidatus Binatia bacterium]
MSSAGWHATSDILKDVLAQLPHAGRLQEYGVWTTWEKVVGAGIARVAQPLRIQDGKLFVIVSHPACVQELQFAKGRIMARLNQQLGRAAIKRVFFVVGDPDATLAWPAVFPRRPLPPLTNLSVPTLGNPHLEEALAAVLSARRRRLAEDSGRDDPDAQRHG